MTSQVLHLLGGPERVRYIPDTGTWMITDNGVHWYPGIGRMRSRTRSALMQMNLDFMVKAARLAHEGPIETRQEAIDAVHTLRAFAADSKAVTRKVKAIVSSLAELPALRVDASHFGSAA